MADKWERKKGGMISLLWWKAELKKQGVWRTGWYWWPACNQEPGWYPGLGYCLGPHLNSWTHGSWVCVAVRAPCCWEAWGLDCYLWPAWCLKAVKQVGTMLCCLPKTMLTSEPWLCHRAMSVSVVLWQPRSVLVSVAPDTTKGHVNAMDLGSHLRLYWCLRALLLLGSYWSEWSVLTPWPWRYPGPNCCQGACPCLYCTWSLWWHLWPRLSQGFIGTSLLQVSVTVQWWWYARGLELDQWLIPMNIFEWGCLDKRVYFMTHYSNQC